MRTPAGNDLGALAVLIPVVGSLVVGLMARYGSERIRGHGIPEAMETILVGGSKVEPRLTALKPISSAISIGTGGPFGAEGPIILTGGALGSVIAQFFHWMWWPAIGGVVVGVGGLIQPRALGVGYDTISAELAGRLALGALLSVFVVKLVIWAIALGSGTSGGILAPILIMGAAVGGLLAPVLPGGAVGAWSVLGMAAVLAGVTRSPLTAVVFSFELTNDVKLLLPLLVASTIAHLVSVLVLNRSILTEKVARRGFHVLREYSVSPLEVLFVRDVMSTEVVTVRPEHSLGDVYAEVERRPEARRQRL